MFCPNPTHQDIFHARLFEEPLVPIGADPTLGENAALASALLAYSNRCSPDDFSSLTGFVDAHPKSSWNAALLTVLGLEYYNMGHYSKTIETWTLAWDLAKAATDPKGKALADRAVGELAYMQARLGRMTELETLLKSIERRVVSGPATERLTGAREALWNMHNRPEIAFRCGPLALHRIKLFVDPEKPGTDLIHATASTQNGFSLKQVSDLAQQLDLNFQMVFREGGPQFIVPSVVHLKLDHYAALVRQEGDRYLLEDPTFGNNLWITREALENEASGYFLVPPGELAYGWRTVEAHEGETVWGKGLTSDNDPGPTGPCDPTSPEGGGNSCKKNGDDCKGMAISRAHLMLVSLNINDDPVGYAPPVGPAVRFKVRYNQREAFQPSTFTYSNFGPKWTFDWLSYITDNPSIPWAEVDYYIMGGGTRTFSAFDSNTQSYAFQQLDQTKLIRISSDTYEMLSGDGTRKLFSHPDGSIGTSRKIFLTQLIDPFGNAITLTYDANLRIVAITDAIGQVTIISYGNPTDIFKITKVTDPFGRFATFDYDASNRLIKITDVIGITSQLTYDGIGDFISELITPYGVTSFTKNGDIGNTRWLETVYSDGNRDRVEYNQSTTLGVPLSDPPQSVPSGMATQNQYLSFRNTFYWDKQACAHAYGDYTKARLYHWLHTNNMASTGGVLESIKEPLEGRVWYDYVGQLDSLRLGSTNKPTHVGRVLDDGSTQLYTYEYNGFGNVTKMVDPVGRTFSYTYAENGLDLLEIRQTRAGQNQLVSQITYNDQHLPLTSKDASGQAATYTYNARGQLLTDTNARGDTTTYHYDANGYCISVDGPLPGTDDTTTWTYDSVGRIQSKTDESGYTLIFDYDALDRLTKTTFPDGTFVQFSYSLLDPALMRDRAGRQTSFDHNDVRQLTKRTDPLTRATLYQWCKCGDLKTLTDPMSRTTSWQHDVQGRVKSKSYVDGSQITLLYEHTTSRLRQTIDEKLQVTHYNYNLDDTVSQISFTNAIIATPSVSFSYDPDYNRLRSMSDGTGTTLYAYIPITPSPSLGAGRLSSVAGSLSKSTIIFRYDELGRRVAREIDGVSSSIVFDAANRITSETNTLGTFDYSYDGPTKRPLSIGYPNGQTATFSYLDILSDLRLERITHTQGTTPISEFSFGYDVQADRIITSSQKWGTGAPIVYVFGYDAANQLITGNGSQSGNLVKSFVYTFDLAGNRLTEQLNGTIRQFAYNALNELISSDPSASPEVPRITQWDAAHRLVSVQASNRTTSFIYDGFGRRVGRRELVDGVEVSDKRYIWSGLEICEERSVTGAVIKRYFPLGVNVETGLTVGKYFYTKDHLGSVRELIDDAGGLRARFDYDPYGSQSRIAGDLESDFGFTGHFRDAGTGLSLTKFRAYDPELGRWLSRDPLPNVERHEPNLYLYVGNNPINAVDLEGMQSSGPPDPTGPTERPSAPPVRPTWPAPPNNPAPDIKPGQPSPFPGNPANPTIPGPPRLPTIPGYWVSWIICGVIVLVFLPFLLPVKLPA